MLERIPAAGSLKLEVLIYLVVILHFLSMYFFHSIHVEGTRMINQGMYGISRGGMYEGIIKGKLCFLFSRWKNQPWTGLSL